MVTAAVLGALTLDYLAPGLNTSGSRPTRAPSTRSSGPTQTTSPCSSGRSTTRVSTSMPSFGRSGTASVWSMASPASSPTSSESCPVLLARSEPPFASAGGPHGAGANLPAPLSAGPRCRGEPGPSDGARPRRPIGRVPPLSRPPWHRRSLRADVAAGTGCGRWSVLVSYDLLRSRPRLRASLRPIRTQAGVEQWVRLTLNGVTMTRTALDTPTILSTTLTGPLRQSEPNVIAIQARLPSERGGARPRAPVGRGGRDGPGGRGCAKRRPALREHGLHPRGNRRPRPQPPRLQPGRARAGRLDPGPRRLRHLRGSAREWSAGEVGSRRCPRARSFWAPSRMRRPRSSAPMRSRPWLPSESRETFGAATGSPTPSSGRRAPRRDRRSRRWARASPRCGSESPTPASAWSSWSFSSRPRRPPADAAAEEPPSGG